MAEEKIEKIEEVLDKPVTIKIDSEETPVKEVEEIKTEEKIPEVTPSVEETNKTEEPKPEEVLKEKGFDFNELQKEYNEKGDITKETREKLNKVGITDEIIDSYIEGKKLQIEQVYNDISTVVGGRDKMKEVIEWASGNLSKEEIESINSIHDPNVIKIVLKELKGRMEDKEGKLPEVVTGTGGNVEPELFNSQAEMMAAIKDKRYETDEAYRASVAKKVKASLLAGKDLGIN